MTHAIYNILSYVIRSSAARSQGNSSRSINISMSLKSQNSNNSISYNNTNDSNNVYVNYEVSYLCDDVNPVC
jgi:hypothetical protein